MPFEIIQQQVLDIINTPSRTGFDDVNKCIRIQQCLGLDSHLEQTQKKLLFMCYELDTWLHPQLGLREKFELLRSFFFQVKRFEALGPQHSFTSQELFMDRVLSQRRGHYLILNLIYRVLAEHIQIPIEFVRLGDLVIMKIVQGRTPLYLSLLHQASCLPPDVMIEHLKENQISQALESVPFQNILSEIIYEHEKIFRIRGKHNLLLLIYDLLLTLNPRNLNALHKRAVLHFQMQYPQRALLDIKRYSYLMGEKSLPAELKMIKHSLEH